MHVQISRLEAALVAGDQTAIQHTAHRMRGGCLQLSAQALAALCAQIETAAEPAASAPLIAQLRPCYHETLAALRQGEE
ncbi:MAG: hypothetical protein EI684_13840 [Candidatus Viridilinea halotolerans]|uniref:HPt domain-containing protein n=1 Tax=Candidatus Viridilinea halotolerans TaxID=2491704 RepID=A0A426TWZ9_9CHLR|nr:MAG: hypothetical protein EI684_13840 [Candidatus Viridilinea halotolerans]